MRYKLSPLAINTRKVKQIIFLFLFCILVISLYSYDNTTDIKEDSKKKKSLIIDENYVPKENLKKMPVVFDMGGGISTKSRILFKSFRIIQGGGFEPVPDDKWYIDVAGKLWTRMSIEKNRFLHLGIIALFKLERYTDKYKRNSIVPLFNIDELYFNWAYPIGKVVIGRTNYSLKSALVFNGPLDGLELNINIPYFNFKTFLGFTGLLGVFNPWFNPYGITSLDRSYTEETNMIYSTMILRLNAEQARRIFFATDFDIHFFGQHINPYFLLQYDLTSLFYNLNTDYDVNTFHLGINFEGRLFRNFYYKINLAGLFGTHPTSTSQVVKAIIACALETKLRYTIPVAAHSTFIVGYSLGTGNAEPADQWSSYSSDDDKGFWADKYDGPHNNKFYYFGKFDGGYVLNPVLSNIHSISFKYMVSPVNTGSFLWTIYVATYQTIKLWSPAPISDDESDINDYFVGTEVDAGMSINIGSHFNVGVDFGIFFPETVYTDRSLRFKMGAGLGFTF